MLCPHLQNQLRSSNLHRYYEGWRDAVLQVPMIKHREIACSDDFEVLEIVSPASFDTNVVDPPV